MPGAMPFGLKIAVINREFRKKMDEKAAAMGLTRSEEHTSELQSRI